MKTTIKNIFTFNAFFYFIKFNIKKVFQLKQYYIYLKEENIEANFSNYFISYNKAKLVTRDNYIKANIN
jgi:hypothetical protein